MCSDVASSGDKEMEITTELIYERNFCIEM